MEIICAILLLLALNSVMILILALSCFFGNKCGTKTGSLYHGLFGRVEG